MAMTPPPISPKRDKYTELYDRIYGMNAPRRIQQKRSKGWRKPDNAVCVGRPSKWGNPFGVGKPVPKVWLHMEFDLADTKKYLGDTLVSDASEAVRLYRKYAAPEPKCVAGMLAISELRGKDLACWCKLDQPCHADVLLDLANAD